MTTGRRVLWCITCARSLELEPSELARDENACTNLGYFLEAHRTDEKETHLFYFGEAPPHIRPVT